MSKSSANSGVDDAPTSQVAEHATESDALALDKPVLLGTFGSPETPRALVRLPAGDVVKVTKGQMTRFGKILGIGNGQVIVLHDGRTTRLVMPR